MKVSPKKMWAGDDFHREVKIRPVLAASERSRAWARARLSRASLISDKVVIKWVSLLRNISVRKSPRIARDSGHDTNFSTKGTPPS